MEKDIEILNKFCEYEDAVVLIDNALFEYQNAVEHLIQAYKEQQAELEKKDEIINKALETAFQYAQIDGGHHKMWVIDQIVRCLTGKDYKKWVKHYEYDEETGDEYTWSEGIAP